MNTGRYLKRSRVAHYFRFYADERLHQLPNCHPAKVFAPLKPLK